MAAPKMRPCKTCGKEIAKSAKTCPFCGAKQKKGRLKWILIGIILLLLIAVFGSSGSDSGNGNGTQKVGEVSGGTGDTGDAASNADTSTAAGDKQENKDEAVEAADNSTEKEQAAEETTAPIQEVYKVGDILMDGGMKIVYAASGEYNEENEYSQPAEGNKYIFLKLAFINESDSDKSISFYSFECYADGYAVDMHYSGEDDLSATLSAGRSTMGYLRFEVPENAQDIEVEYDSNIFSDQKIRFAYEGDKDSGFVLEKNTSRTAGALNVGEEYDDSNLKITYLNCDVYDSDNSFIQPRSGYHYIYVELEFENLSDSDKSISTYSFDCYADGTACEQTFIRDDDFSATLSAGRKAKGTATFEVPDDAKVVEVEYNDNIWTSHRIAFTIR